ncbi:hypothetical protein ONE63_002223 [Megalurothrips usitatus]|uniref:DOMON domain-containing protein n=1 Tax=Megalurothrips usitatus TaxID=439358 RepID=A0AAV7X9W7_9NEOP|nr:hypothetical protein ONE63_002223 [Megalurothrips usitatus]
MAGADLVIAWVDGAGLAHARDYWADQNGTPTLDKAQDWSVVGAVENDTHTVVRLARPLRTRHVMDVAIQPGPTRVIFSWSDADPGQAPHYHGKEQRGVCEVHLLADSASTPTWAHRRAPVVALAAWALVLPCLVRSPL